VVEVKDLEFGRLFIQITLDKPGGPNLVRNFPAVIRDRSNKDFTHHCWFLRWKEAQAKEWGSLQKVEKARKQTFS